MSDTTELNFDLEQDDFETDEDVIDGLADFDSSDLWQPKRKVGHDYLDSMWGKWSFRGRSYATDDDILVAHGMVQSFINAFARDGVYEVVFSKDITTAGTDMKAQRVVITTAPIVDQTITAVEAGRILTGLATHEISHPRFGKATHWAIRAAFKGSRAANHLGNLLDDVRIERRFIEQYPGYADVFEPTLEYVGRGSVARNGGQLLRPLRRQQLNLSVLAVRYPNAADWTGIEDERDWWQDWARRWGKEDAPKRVVEAVREALRHIAAVKLADKLARQAESKGDGQQGGDAGRGDGDEARDTGRQDDDSDGSDGDSGGDEKIDAESAGESGGASQETGVADDEDVLEQASRAVAGLGDEELGEAADEDEPLSSAAPTCAGGGAVQRAAIQNGADQLEIQQTNDRADEAVEEAKLYEDDGMGGKVDVARSMKKLINSRMHNRHSMFFAKSDVAARYIRDAIMRSRTGHTNVSHYQKRGRLDQHAIHRVARGDYRLFDRKHAPSPDRFLIWMLLDRSGSMDGRESVQQAQVATAIADALKHVPTVRAAVWAWSNSFRNRGDIWSRPPGAALAWQTGQPTTEIARTIDLPSGGTPDAEIMSWAYRAIKRELRHGERPVIILCSDGWGSSSMTRVVKEARDSGVEVVSVAFGNLDEDSQLERFGRNGYVTWQGSIIATSRPLARMIAKLVGRDRRR